MFSKRNNRKKYEKLNIMIYGLKIVTKKWFIKKISEIKYHTV